MRTINVQSVPPSISGTRFILVTEPSILSAGKGSLLARIIHDAVRDAGEHEVHVVVAVRHIPFREVLDQTREAGKQYVSIVRENQSGEATARQVVVTWPDIEGNTNSPDRTSGKFTIGNDTRKIAVTVFDQEYRDHLGDISTYVLLSEVIGVMQKGSPGIAHITTALSLWALYGIVEDGPVSVEWFHKFEDGSPVSTLYIRPPSSE